MKSLDTASNSRGLFRAAGAVAAGKNTRSAPPVCHELDDVYLHLLGFFFFSLQLLVNFNKNDDLGNCLCVFHRSLHSEVGFRSNNRAED